MLVITRKTAESFHVGENVKITILEVSGDKIKIGIDAPKEIKIVRSEVLDTIQSNQQAISASVPSRIDINEFNFKKSEKDSKQ